MRSTSDFLAETRKYEHGAEFSCFVRNSTPRAVHVNFGFGMLEAEPQMSSDAHRALRSKNRAAYASQVSAAADDIGADTVGPEPDEHASATPPLSTVVDPNW